MYPFYGNLFEFLSPTKEIILGLEYQKCNSLLQDRVIPCANSCQKVYVNSFHRNYANFYANIYLTRVDFLYKRKLYIDLFRCPLEEWNHAI